MAYTVKGRRVAFDNISATNPAGREAYAIGATPGTTNNTTVYGNAECLFSSPHITSPTGSAQGREKHWRTVCGGAVTDYTTDRGH